MALSPMSKIEAVVRWLRAGYPLGVPRGDYVALYAVLHRRLTNSEIETLVTTLTAGLEPGTAPTIDRAEIQSAIAALAIEQPGEDDIARVASRLAAGGWPLADFD